MSINSKVSISKRKLLLTFISVALICSLGSGSFVYVVAQGGSTPITISSGIYPGAPTYTVWADSGTYYSKNAYGVVTSSPTFSTLINNDFTVSGSVVELTSNTIFYLSSAILPSENSTLRGSPSSILKISSSTNVNAIKLDNTKNVQLLNFAVDGNYAGNTEGVSEGAQSGILLTGDCQGSIISGLSIYNTIQEGIRVGSNNITISVNNIKMQAITWAAILLDGDNNIVFGNHLVGSSGAAKTSASQKNDGVTIYDALNNIVSENTIHDFRRTGVYSVCSDERLGSNIISKNLISNVGEYGVEVVSGANTVSENKIYSSYGNGIYINGAANIIYANTINGSRSQAGIALNGVTPITGATGNNNQISGNTVSKCSQAGINLESTNGNILQGNIVFDNGLDYNYGVNLADSSYNTIVANRIFDDQTPKTQVFGIRETGTSDYNTISSCDTHFPKSTGNGILTVGANTKTSSSWNDTVYVSGSTTPYTVGIANIQSGDIINHNLGVFPSCAFAEIIGTTAGEITAHVYDKDATKLTIQIYNVTARANQAGYFNVSWFAAP